MLRLGGTFVAVAAIWLAAAAPASAAAPVLNGEPGASPQIGTAEPLSAQARALQTALTKATAGHGSIEKAVFAGVNDYYAARGYEPSWVRGGTASRQMSALRRTMNSAAVYGLDPALYTTPGFDLTYPDDVEVQAAADVAFSRAVALFVTHLQSGRVDPGEISKIVTLAPERPAVGDALARLSRTPGVALAVSRHEPQQPQYRTLKAKLAELGRRSDDPARIVMPDGVALKPGNPDARVPLLRERLGVAAGAISRPDMYDEALADAVKAFQGAGGLTPDGILGPRTLLALNGASREDDIASIVVNMERWRWMPRDLGTFHAFVNVPEYIVRVVQDGSEIHQTRVVVGSPKHPTPTFSHIMDHLVVNPFWNVPVSIVSNEMLPEIQRNPSGYFSKRGYQVLAKAGGKMRVVNPDAIDWGMINPRSFRIRQKPGDANALGRIKFMFPNQHSVYLHDTPSKALFKKDYRAYSHGCVRVDNPLDFADAILAVASPDWNSGRLEKLYGGPERRINLDHPVPVHLAYFTMAVDGSGIVHRFEDIYGYDEEMRSRFGPQG